MDLTVVATPAYFATMAAEHEWLKRRAARRGSSPADYTKHDTLASLSMGVGSLLGPLAAQGMVRTVLGRNARGAKVLAGLTLLGAAVTTAADVARRRGSDAPRWADRVAPGGGVATMAGVGILASVVPGHLTSPKKMWVKGRRRDLGAGVLPWTVALVGWDFIYYWNHRFMHEVRVQWAHHVVHHSSEHYNLSTALRQPVSPFGLFVPYGLLARAGVRPWLIEQSRALNLLYQYWIHTDTVRSLGGAEHVLNTPSHHRVHHGSNRRYIDRNHGSFLIVWDRLFGTFQREDAEDPVIYGLTRNIDTYHPWRIATHEYRDMLRDVAESDNWRDRLSFVLRSPGWAYRRSAERGTPEPLVAA